MNIKLLDREPFSVSKRGSQSHTLRVFTGSESPDPRHRVGTEVQKKKEKNKIKSHELFSIIFSTCSLGKALKLDPKVWVIWGTEKIYDIIAIGLQ